jgi:3-hydroxyacyl-CoA dehydrogenase
MSEGRSEDFRNTLWNSLLTLRYLKLFEIIPGPQTSSEVLDFLQYMERNFGKTSVVAKDTPAFIGNRIGIYGTKFVPLGKRNGTIEEVDKLTSNWSSLSRLLLERRRCWTRYLSVANGIYENCPMMSNTTYLNFQSLLTK